MGASQRCSDPNPSGDSTIRDVPGGSVYPDIHSVSSRACMRVLFLHNTDTVSSRTPCCPRGVRDLFEAPGDLLPLHQVRAASGGASVGASSQGVTQSNLRLSDRDPSPSTTGIRDDRAGGWVGRSAVRSIPRPSEPIHSRDIPKRDAPGGQLRHNTRDLDQHSLGVIGRPWVRDASEGALAVESSQYSYQSQQNKSV